MRNSLLALLFLVTPLPLVAAENLSDHEAFCQQNAPQSCLALIEQNLALLPKFSPAWYKMKSYQLDYFYDGQTFTTLYNETEALLAHDALPDAFQLQLYFYYAKTSFYLDKTAQARHYAHLAVTKLQDVFSSFGTPLRLVELANLHISLQDLNTAYQLIGQAEQQFRKHRDPLFWYEFYSNKAQIFHLWDDLKTAQQYRQLAVDAALAIGHQGKIITAYGNLARTQQLQAQYNQAYQTYLLSLPYFTPGVDDAILAIHQLRLAEISWQQQEFALAQHHLAQINRTLLRQYHNNLYQQLCIKPELSSTQCQLAATLQ